MIPGIIIPNWETVIEYCKGAAQLIPNYGYVGWDIAVCNEKVCIIEGNEVANIDVPQTASQRGFKVEYWEMMEKVKADRI